MPLLLVILLRSLRSIAVPVLKLCFSDPPDTAFEADEGAPDAQIVFYQMARPCRDLASASIRLAHLSLSATLSPHSSSAPPLGAQQLCAAPSYWAVSEVNGQRSKTEVLGLVT